jgi:hypothetical protein
LHLVANDYLYYKAELIISFKCYNSESQHWIDRERWMLSVYHI